MTLLFGKSRTAKVEGETITYIIYETRGRAKEYCELAANLYRGCSHGCIYCYAPSATYQKRENFLNSCVREDVINKLEKDAILLEKEGEVRPILLSFTTDPYQPLDVEKQLTRKAIEILHKHNLKVTILTKGGKRSERDFDLLVANPDLSEYGATLVFTDEELRSKIEPFAASTTERISSLKKVHELGIRTFVSLEPVWDAKQTLELIDLTHECVDLYKIGKLNYHPQQKETNWREFKRDVLSKLQFYKKDYFFKKELRSIV
ncbi:MAG: radical SAM protein [Methanobacterium sp.]